MAAKASKKADSVTREEVVAKVYATASITLERAGITVEVRELPYERYNDLIKLIGQYSLCAAEAMGIDVNNPASTDQPQGNALLAMLDVFTANEAALLELTAWQVTGLSRDAIRELQGGDKLQLIEECLNHVYVKDVQRFFRVAAKMATMCDIGLAQIGSSPI